MKKITTLLLIALCMSSLLQAQVKIGDNPQNIDASSILELESNSRVLVITRINTAEMNAILPNQGALVYNTDTECIHYYNGTNWISLCESGGSTGNFTTDAIVNDSIQTIVITQTADGLNFEVALNSITQENMTDDSIGSDQIQARSIEDRHIKTKSIGPNKLADDSVDRTNIRDSAVGNDAIDFSEVDLSSFTNITGFITSADIVSIDPGNAIENRPNGIFVDQQPLLDAIDINSIAITDHIAADNDISSTNEIQLLSIAGNTILLSDGGSVDLPTATVDTDDQGLSLTGNTLNITDGIGVDLTPILGGTNTDEQQLSITGNTISLTNGGSVELPEINGSETIIDATNSTVGVTGTGTTIDPYVLTGSGGTADGSETIIDATNSTVGVTGTGTTIDPYVLTGSGGTADGAETIIDATNSTVGVTGTGTTANPYILTATAGDGSETVIDATNSTVGVTGTGTTADPYILTATATDGSETIIDATNSTVGVAGTGTTADPYILTATAADGSETVIDATNSTVGVTGTGTTADPYILTATTVTGEDVISTNGTITGIQADAALVAMDLEVKTDDITLEVNPDDVTGLQIKDEGVTSEKIADGTITTDDIFNETILSEDLANKSITLAKLADAIPPTLENAVMRWDAITATWQYAEIATLGVTEVDGIIGNEITDITAGTTSLVRSGTGLALDPYTIAVNTDGITANEINADVAGTGLIQNATTGALDIDPVTITAIALNTAKVGITAAQATILSNTSGTNTGDQDISGIATNVTVINALEAEQITQNTAIALNTDKVGVTAAQAIILSNSKDLGSRNLTQTSGEDRTYNLNGQDLFFDGTGSIGIGTVLPTHKLTVVGSTRSSAFIANPNGSQTNPPYRFVNDPNSGMFLANVDQLAFTTNSVEAIRIDANQNVGIGTTTPSSTLHTGGSFATAIERLSGIFTLDETQHTIIVTGASTISLPAVGTFTGRIYIIKNPASVVTITGYTNLAGITGTTDIPPSQTITLQSDGANWQQIN